MKSDSRSPIIVKCHNQNVPNTQNTGNPINITNAPKSSKYSPNILIFRPKIYIQMLPNPLKTFRAILNKIFPTTNNSQTSSPKSLTQILLNTSKL